MNKHSKLFEPLRVGGILLKNRIIAAPVSSYGFKPSPVEDIEALAAKARGGAALVIIGSVPIDDDESVILPEAGSLTGYKQPLYQEYLSVIHQYGAKASVQLLHCGNWAATRDGVNPVGPYTFERSYGDYLGLKGIVNNAIMDGKTVIGIDEAKMEKICDRYAQSALAAKQMGFDMVMLHFAHGWLPAQFLSPFFNRRKDEYGGCFENRIRFPMMIVERVRKAVGPHYPLDMRICASERIKGGIKLEDAIEFIKRVEDKIDMVHISSGLDKFLRATTYVESLSVYPHLLNADYAEKVKKAVNIPVVTVSGITKPDEAEKLITENKVDAVALGRAFIADSEWANKARRGEDEDITPCLRCCSCYVVATGGNSQGCAVNPRYGRQLRLACEPRPAEKNKRVVIIGGGPAGMKAAITAARQGHKVTLFEKQTELGGVLRISDFDKGKIDMRNYKNHLIHQMSHSNITVKLGNAAAPDVVSALHPDVIIVALGALPVKPRIVGIDGGNVMSILDAHFNEQVLGGKVAVIGGGPAGCELALSLVNEGREVRIIEQTGEMAAAGNALYRAALDELFDNAEKLICMTNTVCTEIGDSYIKVREGDGYEQSYEVNHVIYAVGMKPLKEEAETFLGLADEVKIIGDCVMPRLINEASHEGYFAGLTI